jgi:hypothetical protein
MHQPRPIDNSLRLLCCSAVFAALGFVGHPNGFWGELYRFIIGSGEPPRVDLVAGFAVGFGVLAWIFGATIETVLVSVGLRLTHADDQAADYDDSGNPGS